MCSLHYVKIFRSAWGEGKRRGRRNLKERSSRLKLKSQYFSKGVLLKKSLNIAPQKNYQGPPLNTINNTSSHILIKKLGITYGGKIVKMGRLDLNQPIKCKHYYDLNLVSNSFDQ